jgi:hypothetical protein
MLRPAAYLSRKLIRPIRTKDGGTLRTGLDARTYMWQRACQLLLTEADVEVFSRQVELALFMEAKLDLAT